LFIPGCGSARLQQVNYWYYQGLVGLSELTLAFAETSTGPCPANTALISTKTIPDFPAKYAFSLEKSASVTYFLTICGYFTARPGIPRFERFPLDFFGSI